ncbi:hypothetical protein VOLCADRAFT_56991 [Volvox carteri f. nagariensis]|uniref:SUI1 domain-containing protein n=1 Tax=Volvox carteri f. nagariensis TaxID=3068 RepID=D8TLX8_VOLCA|nr:uncharacterized protein VOLCADRAFT_56991 [Volvox carteri f. nagariensis]EFJ51539.1 hypothetical protein VOLCADRAFT_56991 [Volvox carteri f. nagariensis]|eukprot:XP_002947491.1 hypothetical protein VOLCADRAFT_56991 [Volvox carteri f. nagariensis]
MFKKPFSIGQSHKVSGADRKKLRRALEQTFGVSEESLEVLLPAKSGELECAKLASPSRVVLYLHDGQPILVDPNGKGDYVPTIFALWRLPTLLPQVHVKHPAVSRYIVGGADLMLPGVLLPADGLPPFERDQLVAVCSPGNAAPVAVGSTTMGAVDATARIRGAGTAGPKGKLVELLQYYGDHLWSDVGGRAVPNEGFLSDGVVPVGAISVEATLGGQLQEITLASTSASDSLAEERPAAAAAESSNNSRSSNNINSSSGSSSNQGAASASGGVEVDMDSLLESVLLQALHKSVKDADLPLNSSILWNQHMLPVRPAGSTLDVKKSKHKKMSKFLQSYGKQGLLTVKEDKHSGDMIVTSVNRNSPIYTDYSTAEAGLGTAASAAGAAAGPSSSASSLELLIEEVYKPGKELRPVFEEAGLNPEALYTAAEAAEAAFAFVKVAGLEQGAPDNRTIVLNATLCDALFKGLIKKGELYPTHLAKSDLRESLMRRMHLQCRITRGQQQVVRKGQLPAVQISTEKRQGNKRVTKVMGLEPFLVDIEQVAAECQRKFACSTSVVELPGKGAGHEVVLQGSFLEPVADFIMQQYGIPKKYFQIKK